MKTETFIPVKCPGPRSGEPCGRYLSKPALSHHCCYSVTCPSCGTQWRLFHDSDSPVVELTFSPKLNDAPDAIIQVSWGRIHPNVEAQAAVLTGGE